MNVMGCRVTLTVMGCLDLNKTLAVTMTCVLGRMGRSGNVMTSTIIIVITGIIRLTHFMTMIKLWCLLTMTRTKRGMIMTMTLNMIGMM